MLLFAGGVYNYSARVVFQLTRASVLCASLCLRINKFVGEIMIMYFYRERL